VSKALEKHKYLAAGLAASAVGGLGVGVIEGSKRRIVGGVDAHNDLHVAAVVDEQDRVLGTHSFATTRQGHRMAEDSMRTNSA
jgi:hypothetical protein